VFVRQYPRKLVIVSPGGFLPGITPENIISKHLPRNRRIAEAFARCGLVERAGQGMDRIFEGCIKESKPRPDFTGTDDHEVWFTLHCDVQDPQFIRFLEKAGREREITVTTQDLLVLNDVHDDRPVPAALQPRLAALVDQGIVEAIGRGRSGRYLLSHQFYVFLGKSGVYTRKRGLDRETNRALLLKHVTDNRDRGVRFEEFMQVLPALSLQQIRWLLETLRAEGRIHRTGRTRATLWFPGPASEEGPLTANSRE
jgi:ATP-dependent DNA helicase RecG